MTAANDAEADSATPLPLADLRVLDLTIARAGPTAVRQLADWGADVVRIEPRRPEPRVLRAQSQLALGRFGPALADYDLALELEPRQSPTFWLGRGQARFRAGSDPAGAASDLKTFLSLAPEHREAPEARRILEELERR